MTRVVKWTSFLLMTGTMCVTAQPLQDRIKTDANGNRIIQPVQDPGDFANPWPEKWEEAFRARREKAIKPFQGAANSRTTDEHEKWGYPDNIGAWLAGDRQAALQGLQAEDLQAGRDHGWTSGIDLYWCFTLKGQVRKWFEFGDQFQPAYQKRYRDAMKTWTTEDPKISMELVGLLGTGSDDLDAYLFGELKKMWRDEQALLKMADEAEAEGHNNKKRFASYIRSNAKRIGGTFPEKDVEAWNEWWKLIAGGGWMIFEEYERRVNPHPHPKYGTGTGPVGGAWNPQVRGMRADARNTDNLRGMREVAAYLFAEASGNDAIRELYKARIRRTAFSFWNVGNGEWDSSTYLGHTMSAYINLYDYAEDPEVRGYAKAIMDILFVNSAVKYRKGAWGGPQVRDYGNHGLWSTSAHTVWLYFGDEAKMPHHKELEHALFFTSGYRPPAAVVALAQKQFDTPQEVFASHPAYENFLPGQDAKPAYHETTYFGRSFQLGTMKEGHGYNRNGFKLLADHSKEGVAYVIPVTGRLKGGVTDTAGGDVIVQHGPAALYWNRKSGGVPFHVVMPKGIPATEKQGVWFLDLENSWVAVHGIGMQWKGVQPKKGKGGPRQVLAGQGRGFVMEVGDRHQYQGLADFQAKVLKGSSASLSGGEVQVNLHTGATMALGENGQVFKRDGQLVNWDADRREMWQPAKGGQVPLSLGWKERKLVVEAGGYRFQAQLHEDGRYEFSSRTSR